MIKANFSLHWLLVAESLSANITGPEETYCVFVLSCVQIGVSLAKMTWIDDQLRTRALIYRKRGGGKTDVQRTDIMWRNNLERFAKVCCFPEDHKVFKRSSPLHFVLVESEFRSWCEGRGGRTLTGEDLHRKSKLKRRWLIYCCLFFVHCVYFICYFHFWARLSCL